MALKDGTKVSITDGECKGSTGVIVGHHAHDPITYAVLLDAPITITVTRDVVIGGRTMQDKEEVTLTRVEVAEAHVK